MTGGFLYDWRLDMAATGGLRQTACNGWCNGWSVGWSLVRRVDFAAGTFCATGGLRRSATGGLQRAAQRAASHVTGGFYDRQIGATGDGLQRTTGGVTGNWRPFVQQIAFRFW